MRDQHWRSGDGFIVVYDISNKQSFVEVSNFIDLVKKSKETDDFPIAILGNKCDLAEMRDVQESAGREIAKSANCLFFETSAKKRINVVSRIQQSITLPSIG